MKFRFPDPEKEGKEGKEDSSKLISFHKIHTFNTNPCNATPPHATAEHTTL